MIRSIHLAAVGVASLACVAASAQPALLAPQSGALPAGASHPAVRTAADAQPIESAPRPFPSVNPRELMPRNWFGVDVQPNQAAAPAPVSRALQGSAGPATANGDGSARARMMRDLDRGEAAAGAAAGRASARAGSVLSPGAPRVEPSPSATAAASGRLARSIAQEVAASLGGPAEAEPSAPSAGSEDRLLPFETPAEPVAEIAPIAKPFADPIADDPTPAAIPVADSFAESTTGKVRVSRSPTGTTKLPLVIGDPYAAPQDSTLAPGAGTAPFAFGPGATTDKQAKPAAARRSEAAPSEDADLLFTQRMPVLVSKVAGPRTITVGQEASYRVLLANRGDVAADLVETRISVPEGAEVVSTKAATGSVERDPAASGATLLWKAARLGAGEVVQLDLRLIARTGRPIDLGLSHSHRPLDGHTMVEVQEPKLALAMIGPEEVLFGKPQTFRLTVSNPGTGAAENVVLRLTPPGGDEGKSAAHDFGAIGAGEERTVEIELTAREAGQLAINASAAADGGVAASATKEVFCRKPELVVDFRGPADRYAGAAATYYFRVRNPGTAPATDVVLTAELPAGFEVQAAEGTPRVEGNRLAFRAGTLRPGDDKYFELRGVLRTPGPNEIALHAAAADETASERVVAVTEVVALADLRLDVLDPKGPVPTGQEIAYEVRVTNRGASDALDVRVIGLFSEGIEPHHVEGGECDIRDGRVAFHKIERMAAGEVRTFTIHARAHQEGAHLFRAEVLCRDLDIKLAEEETTRFFRDDAVDVAGEGYRTGAGPSMSPR